MDDSPVADTDANVECNDVVVGGEGREGAAETPRCALCCGWLSRENVANAEEEIPRRSRAEGCETKHDETGYHTERRKRALREGTIGSRKGCTSSRAATKRGTLPQFKDLGSLNLEVSYRDSNYRRMYKVHFRFHERLSVESVPAYPARPLDENG
jgi:hypothetical protein